MTSANFNAPDFEDLDFEGLEALLLDWEEGCLESHDVEKLQRLLQDSPRARELLVQSRMLSAALQLESELLPDSSALPITQSEGSEAAGTSLGRFPRQAWQRFFLAVACGGLLAVLGRWAYLESNRKAPSESIAASAQEATTQGIAIVTELVGVTSKTPETGLQVGSALRPGVVAFDSGVAQIEFFCGAMVILEGPAEMELLSSTEAVMRRGKLRAVVPPAARGFVIHAKDLDVVDLGTEFGIEVTEQDANIQVYDGEVELHPQGHSMQLLTAGKAMSHVGGQLVAGELTPERFVDSRDLQSLAASQDESRYQNWLSYSEKLKRDPRLVAYYGFDQPNQGRKLRNLAQPENSELDGAIVGAAEEVGRWPQKSGLSFKHPGDRVRLMIPGEYSSLTLAAWVKIDSLDRWYNSLFLTDSYELGEPHWQILNDGRIHFSVRPSTDIRIGPEHYVALSPSFWEPGRSGKWLHLAVVYNVEEATTTHYVDGQILSTDKIPESQLVRTTRIGMASIGNWSTPTKPDAHFAIRNLNGSIDEFAIFKAALSSDEIREMAENGRP